MIFYFFNFKFFIYIYLFCTKKNLFGNFLETKKENKKMEKFRAEKACKPAGTTRMPAPMSPRARAPIASMLCALAHTSRRARLCSCHVARNSRCPIAHACDLYCMLMHLLRYCALITYMSNWPARISSTTHACQLSPRLQLPNHPVGHRPLLTTPLYRLPRVGHACRHVAYMYPLFMAIESLPYSLFAPIPSIF